LQEKLNTLGFDVGKPDGIWGPKSRKAIRLYQLQHNLIADGFPNSAVLIKAGIQG
ncbi:peptidoglycan-binding protein, partial [Colwellia sp. BRX8-8]|nr:peptidoglycan-binding protein [Colwellia sp. BRX8-8]